MLRILNDDFDQKVKNIHDEMDLHHSYKKKRVFSTENYLTTNMSFEYRQGWINLIFTSKFTTVNPRDMMSFPTGKIAKSITGGVSFC